MDDCLFQVHLRPCLQSLGSLQVCPRQKLFVLLWEIMRLQVTGTGKGAVSDKADLLLTCLV